MTEWGDCVVNSSGAAECWWILTFVCLIVNATLNSSETVWLIVLNVISKCIYHILYRGDWKLKYLSDITASYITIFLYKFWYKIIVPHRGVEIQSWRAAVIPGFLTYQGVNSFTWLPLVVFCLVGRKTRLELHHSRTGFWYPWTNRRLVISGKSAGRGSKVHVCVFAVGGQHRAGQRLPSSFSRSISISAPNISSSSKHSEWEENMAWGRRRPTTTAQCL